MPVLDFVDIIIVVVVFGGDFGEEVDISVNAESILS